MRRTTVVAPEAPGATYGGDNVEAVSPNSQYIRINDRLFLSFLTFYFLSSLAVSEVRAARAAECSETDRSFLCSYFRKGCVRSTAARSTEV